MQSLAKICSKVFPIALELNLVALFEQVHLRGHEAERRPGRDDRARVEEEAEASREGEVGAEPGRNPESLSTGSPFRWRFVALMLVKRQHQSERVALLVPFA